MKKRIWGYILIAAFLFVGMVTFSTDGVEAATGTWKKSSKGYWYSYSDGTYAKNTWLEIGGKWYHFDSAGYMQTGWLNLSGKWYYLASSGALQTGWKKISNKWYYFNSSGVMQTGWHKLSGKWYYFNSSGVMQTGWLQLSKKWYYFNSDGSMLVGWLETSKGYYCFDDDGSMFSKTVYIEDDYVYWIGADGLMKSSAKNQNDIQFLIEDVYYKGTTLVVKGHYVNTSKTRAIVDFTSMDLHILDANEELVTSVNYRESKTVAIGKDKFIVDTLTLEIPKTYVKTFSADLSEYSYYSEFYGVQYK